MVWEKVTRANRRRSLVSEWVCFPLNGLKLPEKLRDNNGTFTGAIWQNLRDIPRANAATLPSVPRARLETIHSCHHLSLSRSPSCAIEEIMWPQACQSSLPIRQRRAPTLLLQKETFARRNVSDFTPAAGKERRGPAAVISSHNGGQSVFALAGVV